MKGDGVASFAYDNASTYRVGRGRKIFQRVRVLRSFIANLQPLPASNLRHMRPSRDTCAR